MGIINTYDMDIVMSGDQKKAIRKLLKDRSYILLTMESPNCSDIHINSAYSCQVTGKDESNQPGNQCVLWLNNERKIDMDVNDVARGNKEEIEKCLNHPSVDELLDILKNKELKFSICYYGGGCGNNEQILNRDFLENILLLHEDEEQLFLMEDSFFDVKIFLQKIDDETSGQKYMKPFDIRKLNINNRILGLLEKESYQFDKDGLVVKYEGISNTIQSQYFVTKFHSNPLWDRDPVCILVYRISAFLLPGTIPFKDAAELKKSKTALNVEDGSRYMIDSIHFNADICFDWLEFKQLIEFYNYVIASA